MESTKFALIFAHNRHEELNHTLRDILPQVDMVVVFDNASEPPVETYIPEDLPKEKFFVIYDETQPPTLSSFWNYGLDLVDHMAQGRPHKVAVLNDDLKIPQGWFAAVSDAMDRTGAAAGCSTPFPAYHTTEILKTVQDRDLYGRLFGPAFILRGEAHIRADDRLQWWWGDTDIDWRARAQGGMVMIPTHTVSNLFANASTVGVLAEQAGKDRVTFADIWGSNPW